MSEAQVPPTASIAEAVEHAARLLGSDPALAERQAREIAAVSPADPRVPWLIGAARRRLGDPVAALALLEPLAAAQPRAAAVHYELGQTRAALGDGQGAIAALRQAVNLKTDLPEAWRALADQLFIAGDTAGADAAYARQIQVSIHDPDLREAAAALVDDRMAVAEALLRRHLARAPSDVAALRMLAEAGVRLGRYRDAERLLRHALTLSPGFTGARHALAIALWRQQKAAEAIPEIERLLAEDPRDPSYRLLHAAALGLIGDHERAAALYEEILAQKPEQPRIWLSLGHAYRTAGRRAEAVFAYQKAIALTPNLGEAYWSLANLKTERFSDSEVSAMRAQLARTDLSDDDRLHLDYALGKALEDAGDDAEAFARYAAGSALRHAQVPWDREARLAESARGRALFTASFFAERPGWGHPAPDPIFIVGLPRSGSTLIEQILASHSAVEGTMELPYVVALAIDQGSGEVGGDYPQTLAALSAEAARGLGAAYLASAAAHRKEGRPLFIDKMPNNFRHLGLILLMLPNARVIDARRHPMATGFSVFKQHFARGQAFSYDLDDIGAYYRDYLSTLRHFAQAVPGWIHTVIYEDLVADPEAEVRRLLAFVGLPFEDACLRFHETRRAVRTASSEQVRRPIFREGLEQWKRFEPWLGPLKTSLGPALADWRT